MSYSLYATLTPVPDQPMSSRKKEKLRDRLNQIGELKDSSQSEAVILLIVEHSRLDGTTPDLKATSLPYGVKVKKSRVSIDLDELPEKLQWILLKFTKLKAVTLGSLDPPDPSCSTEPHQSHKRRSASDTTTTTQEPMVSHKHHSAPDTPTDPAETHKRSHKHHSHSKKH